MLLTFWCACVCARVYVRVRVCAPVCWGEGHFQIGLPVSHVCG